MADICNLCGTPIRHIKLKGGIIYRKPCICGWLKPMQLGNVLVRIQKDLDSALTIIDTIKQGEQLCK